MAIVFRTEEFGVPLADKKTSDGGVVRGKKDTTHGTVRLEASLKLPQMLLPS